MLTLGLPTTAVAAVMLAAFQQYGIQPGPLLFEREPELVWGLIASLFVGMVLLLALNLPLAPLWAKLLRIPRPYLYAGILFFAAVGAYAVGGEAVDLVILLVIGLIGFGMRRYGLPVLPAIIAVILGPSAEQQAAPRPPDQRRQCDRSGQHPVLGDRVRRRRPDPGLAAGEEGAGAEPDVTGCQRRLRGSWV